MALRAVLSRSFLYKVIDGATRDPSVSTIYDLAHALRLMPIVLFRLYDDREPRSHLYFQTGRS